MQDRGKYWTWWGKKKLSVIIEKYALNGKTWLDGTLFFGHKNYIKRKEMPWLIQKSKN